jgi:hypothetical protein
VIERRRPFHPNPSPWRGANSVQSPAMKKLLLILALVGLAAFAAKKVTASA